MNNEVTGILIEAIRVLMLVGIPVVLASLVAGAAAGVLQAVTAIQEPVVGYAARLGAIAAVLYFMLPSFSSSILSLAERAFRT